MTITILRTPDAWWVRTPDVHRHGHRTAGAARIDTDATTTGELLAAREQIEAARASKPTVDPATLDLVSPVTAPCRVVAQMTNFASHVKDAGLEPGRHPADLLPEDVGLDQRPVRRHHPARSRALPGLRGRDRPGDRPGAAGGHPGHRGELDLVRGRPGGDQRRLGPRRAAAQDPVLRVQVLPHLHARGPSLVLFDDDELKRFGDLRLRLWVNGELRQDSVVDDDMIYPPLEALQALSRFQRLDPGDLLLTGTPEGTALSAPPKPVEFIARFLPPALKWKLFFQRQAQNPKYLNHGDVVEVTVGTDDGAIDLGRQRTVVRSV